MTPINILKRMAEGSGGTNVRDISVVGQLAVEFEMEQGQRTEQFQYVVRDDAVYLRQLTGPEQGQEGEVATLSYLLEMNQDVADD